MQAGADPHIEDAVGNTPYDYALALDGEFAAWLARGGEDAPSPAPEEVATPEVVATPPTEAPTPEQLQDRNQQRLDALRANSDG